MFLWIAVPVAGMALLLLIARTLRFEERDASQPLDDTIHMHHVTTKRRIMLKGPDGVEREFESLDDVPIEFRRKIQDAMASGEGCTRVVLVKNGERQEFDSIEAVPTADRERIRHLTAKQSAGVMIEVNGERHHFESPDDVPEELRKFVDTN